MFFKDTKLSFRLKLLLSLFGLNLIVGTSIIIIAYNDLISSRKDLLSKNIQSLAFSLSEQIKPALEFDDKKTVEEIIDGTLSYPGAEFVGIWKTDPFLSSSPYVPYFSKGKKDSANYAEEIKSEFQKNDFIEWKAERVDFGRVIFSGQAPIGFLYLSENLESFFVFKRETLELLITSLLIYLISTILISIWIERKLTKPLVELVNVAEKISVENTLGVRAKKLSNDEFGKLTTVFNKMLDSIRDTNEQLVASNKEMESRVIERTKDLDEANKKLQAEMQAKVDRNKELINLQNQMSKQQRLASVGQVSSNIAHELRNPMAAIRNSVYFLRKSLGETGKSAEHLEIIDQQLTESDEVIGKLLEITKEKALQLSDEDLKGLCVEALSVLGFSAQIRFTFESNPDDLKVSVDKTLFRQILLNLFLNSVQATEKNNRTHISVKTYKVEGYTNIEISDNACGIPNKIQKRVFEPLFSSRKDGFGLGLSLCFDLLSRHRGSIEIKQSTPLGTTFFIRIPDSKHS